MSNIFNNSSLPLWVFIVVISVGSVVVLGTVGVAVRCWFIRRKSRNTVSDLQPMRRVTVRRGRIVPASHYLSLTGSRFGLNQFEDNDILETTETTKTRSRSPFEWWSTIKDKRHTHHDDMLQTDSGSTRSRANSRANAMYWRKDLSHSTHTLEPVKEPVEKIEEVPITALPSAPTPLPTRSTSFSRPFVPRTPTSPFTHVRTLSKIEETSPHTSIISTKSTKQRSSRLSGGSAYDPNLSRTNFQRPTKSSSRTSPTSTNSSYTSLKASLTQASLTQAATPEAPRPIAYRGSRSSLGEHEQPRPSLSAPSSARTSRHDSLHSHSDISRRGSKTTMGREENVQDYWGNRPDLQPVHVAMGHGNSRKGNVLRKKSLRKAEIISMVDA